MSRDHILGLPFEKRNDVIHDATVQDVETFGRLIGVMGRQHDLVAAEDRVISR